MKPLPRMLHQSDQFCSSRCLATRLAEPWFASIVGPATLAPLDFDIQVRPLNCLLPRFCVTSSVAVEQTFITKQRQQPRKMASWRPGLSCGAMRGLYSTHPSVRPVVQHEFFIPGGVVGAARRMCAHLPPEAMVRSTRPPRQLDSMQPAVMQVQQAGLLARSAVPGWHAIKCVAVPLGMRCAGHAPLPMHRQGGVRRSGSEGCAAGKGRTVATFSHA